MVSSSVPNQTPSQRVGVGMQRNFVQWFRSAQAAIGWAVILIIAGCATGVYLQQVSQTALIGRSAEILDLQLQDLRYQNTQIRQHIANEQAIQRVQSRSSNSSTNWVSSAPEELVYLEVIVPAPEPPPPPAPEPLAVPPATIGEVIRMLVIERVSLLGRGVSNGE